MCKQFKSSAAVALAAALVLSSIGFNSAKARSRHYHRGNAAAVGAVIGLFGVIAAAAAADSYRDRYYYGDPYYGPYYGPTYGYAPVYRYRSWHHHRHYHHH